MPIPPLELLVLLAIGAIFIGLLIGLVGVGGVLLAPLLLLTTDLQFDIVARISLGAFFFTGIVGTSAAARQLRPPFEYFGAAAAGAVIGILLGPLFPSESLVTCLAVLAVLSGLLALVGTLDHREEPLPRIVFGPVAFLVGAGSAVTGTGGPVLLAPILLLMKADARDTSRLAQVIQLPVGAVGLVAALWLGPETGFAAIGLGCLLAMGAVGAQRMAGRISVASLRRLIGLLLCTFGLLHIGPSIAEFVKW